MQVTDHIHALKVPFHVTTPQGKIPRFVYTYLIYGDRICLIDSGVASSEKVIFDYMKKTGRSPEDISILVLTHSHPDHIGAAKEVVAASGCNVAAHFSEVDWIEDVDLQARQRPVPGFGSLVSGPVKVDRHLSEGDILKLGDGLSLKVIHTPGHSRGSISLLLQEEKALFSADAVPIAGDLPIYDDIVESVRTVQRLRAMEGIELLLAAWDDPRSGDEVYRIMDDGLRYLKQVHRAVRRVDGASPGLEPVELARRVFKELGMPEAIANPLVARSFLASLAARDSPVLRS
jgi:hydroxyacylglutathione hydrolase